MISDFVKGQKKFEYPDRVQMGINLHRKIDEYTDFHPATKQAKKLLKDAAGPYAGAFVDIVYDHFLANDQYEFEEDSLTDFARNTYSQLEDYEEIMPEKFRRFFFYMRTQDWLSH